MSYPVTIALQPKDIVCCAVSLSHFILVLAFPLFLHVCFPSAQMFILVQLRFLLSFRVSHSHSLKSQSVLFLSLSRFLLSYNFDRP